MKDSGAHTRTKSVLRSNAWFKHTFRSFSNKDYRLYACAQLISNSGSWIQLTAISWLVFDITSSPFLLGLVAFLRQSPVMLLGFFGGWLADNYSRKHILLYTKVSMLLQAGLLGLLTISGKIQLWNVLLLATTLGIVNAIDMPAKQALTFNLVARKHLVNAVSLNTSSFHLSRTLGPVVAASIVGILGPRIGEGICFFINSATFFVVILVLFKIKTPINRRVTNSEDEPKYGMKKVFEFVFQNYDVKCTLILGAITCFLCLQYTVLMPVFARTILQRGIDGFGILMASAAIGSFLAAINLANKVKSGNNLVRVIEYSALALIATLVLFSWSSSFYFSCLLATLLGFFSTSQLSSSHSLIQLAVDDSLRGRVLSMWMIVISGLGPIGGLLAGFLASRWGAPMALGTFGIVASLFVSMLLVRKWFIQCRSLIETEESA